MPITSSHCSGVIPAKVSSAARPALTTIPSRRRSPRRPRREAPLLAGLPVGHVEGERTHGKIVRFGADRRKRVFESRAHRTAVEHHAEARAHERKEDDGAADPAGGAVTSTVQGARAGFFG